jgi:hypothetical protein
MEFKTIVIKSKIFPVTFLGGFTFALLLKAGMVNAQAPAVRAITNNADDIGRAAPGITAAIMAMFTQNPLLAIFVVIVILGGIAALANR